MINVEELKYTSLFTVSVGGKLFSVVATDTSSLTGLWPAWTRYQLQLHSRVHHATDTANS